MSKVSAINDVLVTEHCLKNEDVFKKVLIDDTMDWCEKKLALSDEAKIFLQERLDYVYEIGVSQGVLKELRQQLDNLIIK